jgi:hypothetical protein
METGAVRRRRPGRLPNAKRTDGQASRWRARTARATVMVVQTTTANRRSNAASQAARARPMQRPVPNRRRLQALRASAAIGAIAGLAGYVLVFVALALDAAVEWAPALAVAGAIAAAASAFAWRRGARTWLAAVGLGSFWLPLAVGLILSLVLAAE